MDVSFDPSYGDEERRRRVYQGEILILAPRPTSLALVEHARRMIAAAVAPHDPQSAHQDLAVEQTVDILARLKPAFIHHPATKHLLQQTLLDFGCDRDRTYQDVPRLRAAYPAEYLTTGIAYANHPHRDTWYAAPACQFNWWMPIYDFDANQGMAFHPRYWSRTTRNTSRDFNYYRWNADGRKNAAQHIKSDTRVQPHAEEPIELEPEVRFVVPAGGIILFSAAHLHSTVRNLTSMTRWSIDFRTVNVDDLARHRGADNADSASTGTSIRDFQRVADFSAMPEAIIAMHENADVADGVAVFTPDTAAVALPRGADPVVEQNDRHSAPG